ncbi:MAG: hypothetical protein ABI790_05355 [Betaproteobacteria bacterium]
MTPQYFLQTALLPALALLPQPMNSVAGRAMVIAICLQESRLIHRRQIGGPARGYAQFEQSGGVIGVLTHPATRAPIRAVLGALDYDPASGAKAMHIAIEHNDILAAAFARLLLFSLPDALPARIDAADGWRQYLKAWRPGKPHRETWDAFYKEAWQVA